jgi:hypothetical protein
MLLKCSDRMNIPGILPTSGNLVTMATVFEIVNAVKLTIEEKNRLAVKQDENGTNVYVTFAETNDFDTEIALTSSQVAFIKECATKASNDAKITIQNFATVQKINAAV